jgi:hypothetical protein
MLRKWLLPLAIVGVVGLLIGIGTLARGVLSGDGSEPWTAEQRYREYAEMLKDTTLSAELQKRLVRTLYLLDRAVEDGHLTADWAHLGMTSILAKGPGRWVGTVARADSSKLTFEVYSSGEQVEVELTEETRILRNLAPIEFTQLREGELVEVFTRDGSETAFRVASFWVQP